MFLRRKSLFMFVTSILLVSLLSACSNTESDIAGSSLGSQQTSDRFENFNRKVFSFNEGVDNLILKPVAKAYKAVTPEPIDNNIGNFFSNLGDVSNAVNNILQGKFSNGVNDIERFVINSTIGFAGLADIASAAGLPKHDEDFGQTLAKWGVISGPYLMLPLLGPSTIRDATAKLSVGRLTDPIQYSDDSLALTVLDTVKFRSDFFAEEEVVNSLSDDKYSALRDVWLQNREFLIRDGEADESADSDLIDELESLESE